MGSIESTKLRCRCNKSACLMLGARKKWLFRREHENGRMMTLMSERRRTNCGGGCARGCSCGCGGEYLTLTFFQRDGKLSANYGNDARALARHRRVSRRPSEGKFLAIRVNKNYWSRTSADRKDDRTVGRSSDLLEHF